MKVQAWGAGGGGGHFKGGQSGDGGGGGFAEALLYVTPDDELEVRMHLQLRNNLGIVYRYFTVNWQQLLRSLEPCCCPTLKHHRSAVAEVFVSCVNRYV